MTWHFFPWTYPSHFFLFPSHGGWDSWKIPSSFPCGLVLPSSDLEHVIPTLSSAPSPIGLPPLPLLPSSVGVPSLPIEPSSSETTMDPVIVEAMFTRRGAVLLACFILAFALSESVTAPLG